MGMKISTYAARHRLKTLLMDVTVLREQLRRLIGEPEDLECTRQYLDAASAQLTWAIQEMEGGWDDGEVIHSGYEDGEGNQEHDQVRGAERG